MPHEALLDKWLAWRGPGADRAALRFILETWSRRGYDGWQRAVTPGLPEFALISEGEPRRLLIGYLRTPADGEPGARRVAMAMLAALEKVLRGPRRECGILLAPAPADAPALAAILPPIEFALHHGAEHSPAPIPCARATAFAPAPGATIAAMADALAERLAGG